MNRPLRVTITPDHRVQLPDDSPTGEVMIIVLPIAPAADPDAPTAEEIAESLALALEMQSTSPVITADLTAMIREDRDL